jgi:hypothetical protein
MFQYVGSPTIIEKIQYGKMLGILFSMGINVRHNQYGVK